MRAERARRAGGRGARMAVGAAIALNAASMLALCFALAFALSLPADAQEASDVGALSGTLKRVKQAGAITLGYRESSLPFSYLNRLRQPIGYSIDLCREIVEDVSNELDGMDIRIGFAPVTPANRLQKVAAGEVRPADSKFVGWQGENAPGDIFRKIGRPIEGGPNTLAARDQPTCATRSWAFASAAVAGCAGSWSTVAF
jgi:hypothetical protein